MDLRELQRPLKQRYRAEPATALITLRASSSQQDSPLSCAVDIGRAVYEAQAHSGVGGPGPFRGRKRSLYEGGIRTPFLARLPGVVPAGRVDDESILSGADLLPTVCKLAGVSLPADYVGDGEDRSGVLRGERSPRARPLYWEWRFGIAGPVLNRSPRLAVRDGRWKLLLNPDRSRVELYDIPADPSELNNLAASHPELVDRLARAAIGWQATLPKGPVDPSAGKNDYPWPRERP